jgi:hypothetical protein
LIRHKPIDVSVSAELAVIQCQVVDAFVHWVYIISFWLTVNKFLHLFTIRDTQRFRNLLYT